MFITFKRGFLIALLVLVGVAALICVASLVMSSGTSRSEEVPMLSALSTGFFMVLAFLAFYAIERGALWVKIWACIGLVLVALGVFAVPLGIWWEDSLMRSRIMGPGIRPDYEMARFIGDLLGSYLFISAWATLTPAILTPRMTWGRIIQALTAVSNTLSVALMMFGIWDRPAAGSEDMERILMAGFVFSGAGCLSILILNRFLGIKVPNPLTSITQSLWIRCPRCLKEQEIASGESRCADCKLLFKLEVEEPRCPRCNYNLHALTRPICPECGQQLGTEEVPMAAHAPPQANP